MIKKAKTFLLSLFSACLLLTPAVAPAVVSAQANIEQSLCGGAGTLTINPDGSCQDPQAESRVNSIITLVVNLFSIIVGIIAVIMIIIGGLKYITSGGDSNNVTTAKNTILYAIIGLIIVALAQILVRFVLSRVTQ